MAFGGVSNSVARANLHLSLECICVEERKGEMKGWKRNGRDTERCRKAVERTRVVTVVKCEHVRVGEESGGVW